MSVTGGVLLQRLGQGVLLPVTTATAWSLPALIAAMFGREAVRTLRGRRSRAREPQERRDARLVLLGAAAGAAAAYLPMFTWLHVRFGMLVVLPAFGATAGLAMSGLIPAVPMSAVRVAVLEPRVTASYVGRRTRAFLWGSAAVVGVVAAVRLVLPEERPIPKEGLERAGYSMPVLAPTRGLYAGAFVVALVLAVLTRAAQAALVGRARAAADPDELLRQDAIRQAAVTRLTRWTTATLLLLSAALLAALPAKMGGVVLGDAQLIQRLTDGVVLGLLAAAAGALFGRGRQRRPIVTPGS